MHNNLLRSIFLISFLTLSQMAWAQPKCGFDDMLQRQMAENPAFRQAVKIADAAWASHASLIQQGRKRPIIDGADTIYEIPVVVHILNAGEALGTPNNPTDAMVEAWIDYTNQVYAAEYPMYPADGAGGTKIPLRFVLAKRDPQCNPTNGIRRVDMSGNARYVAGGIQNGTATGIALSEVALVAQWPIDNYYNIYIVNKINGEDGSCTGCTYTLGFAFFGGAPYSIPENDGAYLLGKACGAGNTTLPHELGHALGLYHTFNEGTDNACPPYTGDCLEDDDKVCDTDPSRNLIGSCPAPRTINVCTGLRFGENGVQHNIMNYSTCLNHFTPGQAERMLFMLKLQRPNLLRSKGAEAPGAPIAFPIEASCAPPAVVTAGNYNVGPSNVFLNDIQYFSRGYLPDVSYPDNLFYIDHTKNCNLAVRTALERGTNYNLTVTTRLNVQRVKAFIDFNNDGEFANPEEMVMDVIATKGDDTLTASITPPATAVMNTPLRMRVIGDVPSADMTPCGPLSYGQAEDFTVIIVPEGALPVILLDFAGQVGPNGEGRFAWELGANDDETASFELERSSDGRSFAAVATVERRIDRLKYETTDRVNDQATYFYRLRLIDRDGRATLSKVVRLDYGRQSQTSLSIFPNPAQSKINIRSQQPVTLVRILDRNGRMVFREETRGRNIYEQQVDVSALPAGAYLIQVTNNRGETITKTIVKQ